METKMNTFFIIMLIAYFIRLLPIIILTLMIEFSKDDNGKRGGGIDRRCNDYDTF